MEPTSPSNPELESFRQQWLSDLRSRNEPTDAPSSSSQQQQHQQAPSKSGVPTTSVDKKHALVDDDEDYVEAAPFDDLPAPHAAARRFSGEGSLPAKKLVTALDHFEKAMEKEAQGNMGDSLTLYRKAYKLDSSVDKAYREKHFPKGGKHHVPASTTPTSTEKKPDSSAPGQGAEQSQPQTIAELIASFTGLAIEASPPEMEGMPQPPCPIAALPDEILLHVLYDVAVSDIANFSRLSLVCKRLAFLVAKEQRIWQTVCLGNRFGFPGMHYHYQLQPDWVALEAQEEEQHPDGTLVSMSELDRRRRAETLALTHSLQPSVYATWKAMFRYRPRIRFNGVYISTVNYVRSGVASTNQSTWGGPPILIVTYYRYLRFFRDGSAISLLSVTEPVDVVHHLTKDTLKQHRDRDRSQQQHHHSALPSAAMPSAPMSLAQKGRWRLSSAVDHPDAQGPADQEGDLFVETEGVSPRYTYRMDLSLRSAGKGGTRNNKLAWRGFYSYNKLTDDWAVFQRKNEKPFIFSRVKSYGLGE